MDCWWLGRFGGVDDFPAGAAGPGPAWWPVEVGLSQPTSTCPQIVPEGQEPPKGADVRAWFDRLLELHANGRNRAELRGLMRTTWDLAQKVTHGDIDDVDAFASAQATVLLVRTTQKLLSTRDDE